MALLEFVYRMVKKLILILDVYTTNENNCMNISQTELPTSNKMKFVKKDLINFTMNTHRLILDIANNTVIFKERYNDTSLSVLFWVNIST